MGAHLLSGEKAIIPSIRKKLGALWLTTRYLSTESRLRLANGLIISRIVYIIQLRGICKISWVRKTQIVLNSAARYVLRKGIGERITDLMEGCKWLSLRQLIVYHSVVTLWKLWNNNKESHLLFNITDRQTRYGRELPEGKLRTYHGRKLIMELSWRENSECGGTN